jgi:hypothetical protein
MAGIQYSPTHQCVCGNPLKVFVSSGRTAKSCGQECTSIRIRRQQGMKPLRVRLIYKCLDCGRAILRGSQRCRPCYDNNRKQSQNLFTCEQCGKSSYRKLSGSSRKKGYKNRFCSMSCKKDWSRERRRGRYCVVHFNTCRHCEKKWASNSKSVCCVECRPIHKKQLYEASRLRFAATVAARPPRTCGYCGTLFKGHGRRKFCSRKCYVRQSKPNEAEWIRTKYKVSRREWNSLRLKVFNRDQYLSYICGEATDPSAGLNDDRYPNAEHVVPASVGGPTSMDNLRCAHRSCNMEKARDELRFTRRSRNDERLTQRNHADSGGTR